MTDRQLRYLVMLADERNMTATAQRLFISQPSLSYLLAHVEKELGVTLFCRDTNPLSLTDAGERYITAARNILGIQRGLENELEDMKKGSSGRLQIGCGAQVSALILPKILPGFIREHPGVKLKLMEERHAQLCESLSSGELDIILVNRPVQGGGTESIFLSQEELILLAPVSFTSQSYEEEGRPFPVIGPDCLSELPFVLSKKSSNVRIMIDQVFTDFKIVPNIIFETSSINTCIDMVEREIGFTMYPHSALTVNTRNVKRFCLPGLYKRELSIYLRKNTYKPQFMEHFIDACKSLVK